MMTVPKLMTRLGIFTAVMIMLLALVFQLIDRPVRGHTDQYSALFTDANGLKAGDDVRMYGVRVGKVSGLELDGTLALVTFTAEGDRPIFTNSTLAIRYQNLTGLRYLDVQQPTDPAHAQHPGETITTDNPVPAFDITTLFNGLQPVLATLTPDDLNQLTGNLLAVVEGDDTRVGSALAGIQDLTDHYVTDRQAVVSTLVHNLGQVVDHLGGKSGNAMRLLTQMTAVFGTLADRIGGLIDFALTIRPVLYPLQSMLNTVGLTGDPNANLDNVLRTAIPDSAAAADTLGRLPGLIQGLAAAVPAPGADVSTECSNGAVQAPKALEILLQEQRIALCNQ